MRISSASVAVLSAAAVIFSCTERDYTLVEATPDAGPVQFTGAADAATDASLPEDVEMCAVTTCSFPHATCPSSQFPCDVNLLTDDENCGGCGISCNKNVYNYKSKWLCVKGECVFGCSAPAGDFQDCDGDVNNGCETNVNANDPLHCGSCEYECPQGWLCNKGSCYHPCVAAGKNDICSGICVNLQADVKNCGECGVVCDSNPPGKPPLHPTMTYGCKDWECDQPVCVSTTRRNCNGDLADGCEVTLGTDQNCSECGHACPPGKFCAKSGSSYKCLCGDGETRCPDSSVDGPCRRLDDDPNNCGGCARQCPGRGRPNFEPTCSLGVCGGRCVAPYADCDRLDENGCEVNTLVDNRNRGACGNACAPNQVCSGGTCLVGPCEPGQPEAAK